MRKFSLYVMALLYLFAGINYFLHKEFYLAIMPTWLGYHELLIIISGICEILFALLLLPIESRSFAAWGIIFLLVAVFPANIQMMVNYYHEQNTQLWMSILRLPLQIVLVWWAYTFTTHHAKAVKTRISA